MLKEIDQRRKIKSQLVIDTDQILIDQCKQIVQLLQDMRDGPVFLKNRYQVINKVTDQGHRCFSRGDGISHICDFSVTRSLLIDVKNLVNEALDNEDVIRYYDFCILINQVLYVKDIMDILKHEHYVDEGMRLRLVRQRNDKNEMNILNYFDISKEIQHELQEKYTQIELSQVINYCDFRFHVNTYNYIFNHVIDTEYRSSARLPTALEVMHLWDLVFDSDRREESIFSLMRSRGMKIRDMQIYVMTSTIMREYPAILKIPRHKIYVDKFFDLPEQLERQESFTIEEKAIHTLKGGKIYGDAIYSFNLKGAIDEGTFHSVNLSNKYDLEKFSSALKKYRLRIQIDFIGELMFNLVSTVIELLRVIRVNGLTYIDIEIVFPQTFSTDIYKLDMILITEKVGQEFLCTILLDRIMEYDIEDRQDFKYFDVDPDINGTQNQFYFHSHYCKHIKEEKIIKFDEIYCSPIVPIVVRRVPMRSKKCRELFERQIKEKQIKDSIRTISY